MIRALAALGLAAALAGSAAAQPSPNYGPGPSRSIDAGQVVSGTLAPGRLPNPSSSSLGGVQSAAPVSHQFVTGISTLGVPSKAQPACADLSDAGAGCNSARGYPTSTFAGLPAASGNSGVTYEVTDVGIGHSFWTSDGTVWRADQKILLCQDNSTHSLTGSTTETTLVSCTVPANVMGTSGSIYVLAIGGNSGVNTNSKQIKAKLGGTTWASANATTAAAVALGINAVITNLGSASAQESFANSQGIFHGANNNAPASTAINTASAQTLAVTGTLAVGTDSLTVYSVRVELWP